MPVKAYWVDPLVKLLPDQVPQGTEGRLDAARGEYEAIQLALRAGDRPVCVALAATPFLPQGPGQPIGPVRVRFCRRVPIKHGSQHTPDSELVAKAPCELPDPLMPTASAEIGAGRTESFWLDVRVPLDAQPGAYESTVTLRAGNEVETLPLALRVYEATVAVKRSLRLTNWFSVGPKWMGYGDARALSEPWWQCFRIMVESMWEHRQNYFWTSLDDWMIPRVVGPDGNLALDFRHFDRWVETITRPDFETYVEGQPITTREGYDGHIQTATWRVQEGKVVREVVEADTPAAREWLRVFLTSLRDHLRQRGWLDRFRIHIGDEPHGHQLPAYATVAACLREFAPEFKIMEALDVRDDFAFFQQNVDVWVPQLGRFDSSIALMEERRKAGYEVWHYTCLFPNGQYPNRLVDYPLLKTQLLHWINFKWGYDGYLHWGWNHWRTDPYQDLEPPHGEGSFLPPGDAWIVYPGDHEIVDSMRHEVMRDGVEDYELLVQLRQREAAQAGEIANKVIRTFTDYERDPAAFRAVRRELLAALG